MFRAGRAVILASVLAVDSGTFAGAMGSELKPETVAAFDAYVRVAEERIRNEVQQPARFLYLDTLAGPRRCPDDLFQSDPSCVR